MKSLMPDIRSQLPADWADRLERLPVESAQELLNKLPASAVAGILSELPTKEAARLLDNLPDEQVVAWLQPVSYTHLDVYKRQGLRCG